MAAINNVVTKLKKVFDDLTAPDGGKKKQTVDLLTGIISNLQGAVADLTNIVKEQSEEKVEIEERARVNEDELDDFKQKNLRGKFIITTTPNKETLAKTQAELAAAAEAGGTLTLQAHIIELALKKYEVKIPEGDIAACHYLPKGGIFFSLWNLRPGSAYSQLTTNIKKSLHKEINVYFNFMLTKRRSGLLFKVRKLRKDGEIKKY